MLYAAYGVNMDPDRMAERAPHSPMRDCGWLVGWRLTFGGEDVSWDGAMCTIVEDAASQVYVVLYELAPEDAPGLDEWEGAGLDLATRIHVPVETLSGPVTALVHVLTAYEGGLPTARYLAMLADAAEAGGAPDDYVADIRTRPCSSDA